MKKNTKERTMAIRFIQAGLILVAILCMACGGNRKTTARDWNNLNRSINNAVGLHHHEMHQNGNPHNHGNGYKHYH